MYRETQTRNCRLTRVLLSCIVAACLGIGCATVDDDAGRDERPQGDVQGAPPGGSIAKQKRFLNPLLLVPTWPFDDGKSQYRLVWSGGDTNLPMFSEPDPNSQLITELSYSDGQQIDTVGDYVAVYQPAIYQTRRRLEISGVAVSRGGERRGPFSRKLRRGASVAVYLYAGGDDCYLGVGGTIVLADCPTKKNYIGSFDESWQPLQMQPLSKIWWVRVSTPAATGWVPLDDRVYADIFPLASEAPPVEEAGSDTEVATETQSDTGEISGAQPEEVDSDNGSQGEGEPADSTVVQTDEIQEREAAMFGGGDVMADATSTESGEGNVEASESGDGGGAGLGSPLLSDDDIEERLEAQEDPLAIGAFAFLQLKYYTLEEGDPEEFTVSAPSLLDVYLDARPNPRVRTFAQGRLSVDFVVPDDAVNSLGEPEPNNVVDLDQLWLSFDVARSMFVTVGKQRIKWGTGRFWNPTDFLNSDRLNPLDVAVFDRRLGETLLKLHFPVEKLGWNFYAFALLEGARTPEDVGGAVRGEFLVGLTEFSLMASARKDRPYRFGADLSTGIWLFDLRLEAAGMYDDPRLYYRGELDLPLVFPEEYRRSDEIIPQVVGGLDLRIPYRRGDTLVVGGEYFYNDAGYSDASLYPWLFNNGAFRSFYAGRQYAGAYALLGGPGNWDDTSFVGTFLANLSDSSYLARLDISQAVLSHLQWTAFGSFHFGEPGELNYGVEIEPNIFAPDGVTIIQPLFNVGIGVKMEL
jgi:hypothetical protein